MHKDFTKLSSVSFFCPAYHDERNLPILIPRVSQFLSEIANTFEIIIVEDGSPDKTGEVANKMAKEFPNVRVIHHAKNMGYGVALRDGYAAAKYEYVMYTDGDNQYDVREFLPYLTLLETADVLSGYVTKKAVSFRRKIQSEVWNAVVCFLFFIRCRDINCAMKIYKRRVLENISIKSSSCFIDAEMIIKAKKAGFKVAQFPVTHFSRTEGLASGSKMNVVVPTIVEMIKYRFGAL
jgi:glycosyltransferase involved in cell wall biosynthesis